ncbi:MAG: preprotein translocase subunit SecA, partial [Clostridiales bacterium]|nr:preprotein translocase subunit SecA [Clostridiales bacterium]
EAIEFGIVSKQIENAQKRVESRNFDIRRHVLEYDDVMNQQRELIYAQRREVLEGGDMRARIQDMRKTLIEESVARHAPDEAQPDHWDIDGLSEHLEHICIDRGGVREVFNGLKQRLRKEFSEALDRRAQDIYRLREKMWEENKLDMREFERVALLGAVDRHWMDHIDAMTELRDGIGLRAIAQRDPVVEYKFEGYEMFEEMIRMIQEDTLKRLYFTVITQKPAERKQVAQPVAATHGEEPVKRQAKADKKVGRNDPCPCGSGKKYKNCCGKVESA